MPPYNIRKSSSEIYTKYPYALGSPILIPTLTLEGSQHLNLKLTLTILQQRAASIKFFKLQKEHWSRSYSPWACFFFLFFSATSFIYYLCLNWSPLRSSSFILDPKSIEEHQCCLPYPICFSWPHWPWSSVLKFTKQQQALRCLLYVLVALCKLLFEKQSTNHLQHIGTN